MGVDWYLCDNCGKIFPDCGFYRECEAGHKMCSCVESLDLKQNDDYEVLFGSCPVCKKGGTKEEQLNKEVHFLRYLLKGLMDGDNSVVNEATNYINNLKEE